MKTISLTLHPDYGSNGSTTIPVNNIAYTKDCVKGTQIFFKKCTWKDTTVMVKESSYDIHRMIEGLRKR